MAENQTASEDSGQQQQQDQQSNSQPSQQQDSSPDQESSSDSITPNPRSKTLNSMRNSLTCIKLPRAISTTTSSASIDGSSHKSAAGKHHHHNHNHHHNHHNSTSSGHGHHDHNVIHRTTSESLRLGSDYPIGGSITNSTSNSSSIRDGSSSLVSTTKNSNSTTSNHSHSMSSSSSHSHSHSHSSRPHSHSHASNSVGGSAASAAMQRKPKTSSFQITSVTVGNKLSSDNGDDSADDLDESHTDDNSRITDLENETPSVSEDTFSKEDVFFANSALSTTAPVIPTSAQYGLVVVDPIGSSVGQTIQNVQVNVADNIINVVSAVSGDTKKPEVKETQHRSERFKVVKIESTEPFRRGRWMCMDYLDHSGNQTTINKEINPDKANSGVSAAGSGKDPSTAQSNITLTNDSSAAAATGGIENHIDATANMAVDGNLNIYRPEQLASAAGPGQYTNQQQTSAAAPTKGGSLNIQPQQLQKSQLPNQFQGQQFEGYTGHGQTMPAAATEFQQQNLQQQQQQQQSQTANNENTNPVAGQSQPASFFANQLNINPNAGGGGGGGSSAPPTFQQQQQQSTPVHGATLPANIHMQNRSDTTNVTGFPNASFVPPFEGGSAPTTTNTSLPSQETGQQQQFSTGHGQSLPQGTYDFASFQAAQNNQQPQQNGNTATNSVAGQSQPASFFANQLNATSNAASASGGGSSAPSTFQQQPQAAATLPQTHGATLPANMHLQNGTATAAASAGFPNTSFAPTFESGSGTPPVTSMASQQTGNYPVYFTQTGPQTYAGAAAFANQQQQQQQQQPQQQQQQQATDTTNPYQQQQQSDSNAATPSEGTGGSGGSSGTGSAQQQPQSQPQQQQQQQFQQQQQPLPAGHSMPNQNQMNFNIQGQQQQSPQTQPPASGAATASTTAPTVASNTTPATIADPTNIAASIQQQNEAFTANNSGNVSGSCSNITQAVPAENAVGGNGGGGGGSNARSNVQQQAPSSSLSVAGSTQGSSSTSGGSGGAAASSSTTGSTMDESQLHHVSETETESASGTSAVAIDNKIEQAMDLVKSHLMIAVREEVEVLKEKISELMDKINQLEVENTILKANMSQETLHQLQMQAQLQIAGGVGSGNMIAPPPQQQQQQTQQQPPAAQQQQQQQQQQQPTTQQAVSQTQQQQQQPQQQAPPQAANPANSTNGPLS